MKILLRLKYVGTDFCGWQFQPGVRTVQKTLTDAAEQLFGTRCAVTGCSRTDSGVHANDFAATLDLPENANRIPPERIPAAFAPFLPDDLSVFSAKNVPEDFHPRYSVVCKEYIYRIHISPVADPFLHGRVWHFTDRMQSDYLDRMNAAAKYLIGKHDFSSFMAAGSKIEDPVRTVKYCDVCADGDLLTVRIAADGFLYNMVRIIAGTLMDVACGRIQPQDMEKILSAHARSAAGRTAPPDGLYLNKVVY